MTSQDESPRLSDYYRLGCPVWASNAWVGALYTSTKRDRWLREYSQVFGTVEGNSTFYGLPALDTVRRWAERTEKGFQFALKFPRDVSHEGHLTTRRRQAEPFLEIVRLLHEERRLGPSFLQLPPHFSGSRLSELEQFLAWLPSDLPWAVEVRHLDFFDQASCEAEFDAMLTELRVDRVLFDSRALFSAPPTDENETESQGRKPKLPYRTTVTARRPMLRLVGRNNIEEAGPWIDQWAKTVADWIRADLAPLVFAHSPDDAHAPAMARRFHRALQEHFAALPDMPTWPAKNSPPRVQRQLF